MRVRHVISTSGKLPKDPISEPESGVVGAALGLAASQSRFGHHLDIWGWNDTQPAQQSYWNGVHLWTSPEWNWARFARWDVSWLAPLCHQGLTRPPVDVSHVHVDPNLLYVPRARIRLLHLQTPVPDPFPPAYRRLLRRADAVTCCSEFIRARFLAVSDYPGERTFVVHNGADLNLYHPDDSSAQRGRWGFSENDIVILYSGAIVPEKGILNLVCAFAQIQPVLPQATLVIVGSSRLWAMPGDNSIGEAYEAEVRHRARGLKIRFLGSVPRGQMPPAYLAADIVVIPSVWDDPHPTVVCEAMAAGKPVVASRAGGITETVMHGETGFLVSPGDEEQLSEAILALASDERLRRKMGQAAQERTRQFTWEASAQRLDDIYWELFASNEGKKSRNLSWKGK